MWAALVLYGAPAAAAQEGPAASPSEPFHKRIWLGGRGTTLFTDLMGTRTVIEATTGVDPPLSTMTFSDSGSKRYGGGPTVHFALTDRIGIQTDFLYRRAGYDSGVIVKKHGSEEDAKEAKGGELLSGHQQRTRTDYWDIPILGRYYSKAPDIEGPRFYVTGGAALRTVTGIKTFNETRRPAGLSDTDNVPVEPAHRRSAGVVVGGGIQFTDEVGVKIDLEVRFTRWLQRTFESGLTTSSQNQGEFLLGLSF